MIWATYRSAKIANVYKGNPFEARLRSLCGRASRAPRSFRPKDRQCPACLELLHLTAESQRRRAA